MFDIPGTLTRRIRWTHDERSLVYTEDRGGVTNIWSVSVEGGPPKKLTDFKDGIIRSLAWSRDGQQLAISRGTQTSDVVLISNFR